MPPTTASKPNERDDETNQSVKVELIDIVQFVTTHKFFLGYTPASHNKLGSIFHVVLLKFPTGSARCTGMTKLEVCTEAFENIVLEELFQADDIRITALDYHRRVVLELFKNKRRYWIELSYSSSLIDYQRLLQHASASLRLAAKRDTDTIVAITKRIAQGLK